MVLFRIPCILILILLAVLVAGCTLIHDPVYGTSIDSAPVSKVTIIPTNEPFTSQLTLQTQCPIGVNTTPWITVNPVGDHHLGDVIQINGTTNIEKGHVSIWIKDRIFHTCLNRGVFLEGPCTCCEGVTLTAPIIPGINGNNTWTTEVNTSQHRFYPAEFLMIISHDCRGFAPLTVLLNITASRPQYNTSENVTLNPGMIF